jgi:hypothetical protein
VRLEFKYSRTTVAALYDQNKSPRDFGKPRFSAANRWRVTFLSFINDTHPPPAELLHDAKARRFGRLLVRILRRQQRGKSMKAVELAVPQDDCCLYSPLHSSSDLAKREELTAMAIAESTVFLASTITGWKSVGGQLLASGVLLLSGHQDIGLRARMGATFGFSMAIAFGISALITAIRGNLWYGAATCAAVLCSETLLILRWLLRRKSA